MEEDRVSWKKPDAAPRFDTIAAGSKLAQGAGRRSGQMHRQKGCTMFPEPERVACHQAGHAVIQAILARGRYRVGTVSLYGPDGPEPDPDRPCGFSCPDREANLNLYELGLALLSGIAAENRYIEEHAPEENDLWGAVSDMREWQDAAMELYRDEGRVNLMSMNIMAKLSAIFEDRAVWSVVTTLADALRDKRTVEGDELQAILADLP
jgi:hypothetical protein